MVVTITQPASGGPFGPGFLVSLNSDFVGPLPSGSFWRVWLSEVGEGSPLVSEDFPTGANAAFWVYRTLSTSMPLPFQFASKELHNGSSLTLHAELRTPTTTEDSGSIPVMWDMTSGVPYVMQLLAQESGGLTVDQAAQIEAIDQAVHMSFPGLPRIPLIDFFPGPSISPTTRVLITPDRTLEGTLDRPGGIFDVNAFGLEWEVVSAPPGAGVAQGAPDRWVRRVLDLQLVGTDANANEYTRSFDSYHVDHLRVLFNPVGLTRIHYWIEPGITIRFYWLLLGI